MYATVSNHLYHGLHYIASFALLFWIWPKTLFAWVEGDSTERAAARYLQMVLLVIGMGYVLVITQLFEVLTIVAILSGWMLYRGTYRYSKKFRGDWASVLAALFFDWTEGKYSPWQSLWVRLRLKAEDWRQTMRLRFASHLALAETVILLTAFAGAAYFRFYDAYVHAAPGLSDGYTTLAWMKYIDERRLFVDGIYPQGFHIVLDTLAKFSFINPLYIQKYTGPFDSILTMAGLYFLVSRLSRNRSAGIVAACVYGFLGQWIGNGWDREAATNSQEFAMVMVFPALWFYHRYLQSNDRRYFAPAWAGLAITGLVHSLVFAYLIAGVACMTAVHWTAGLRMYGKRTWRIIVSGGAAGIVSILPAGWGLLIGRRFQSSSQDFLFSTSRAAVTPPQLHGLDLAAVVAIGITFLCAIVYWRDLSQRAGFLFGGLFAGGTFLLYELGGTLTNSVLISSRAGDLWSLSLPFVIGLGWAGLFAAVRRFRSAPVIEIGLAAALLAVVPLRLAPSPIVPYKMEWDSSVEQYLRISSSYRPKAWMIFSQEEGYALVEGTGYHSYIRDLLSGYDPNDRYLTRNGDSEPDANLPPDIFICEEKEVFEVSKTNVIYALEQPIYERRKSEMKELDDWINQYKKANGGIDIYYEDAHIRIYHIHRELSQKEKQKQIWNH